MNVLSYARGRLETWHRVTHVDWQFNLMTRDANPFTTMTVTRYLFAYLYNRDDILGVWEGIGMAPAAQDWQWESCIDSSSSWSGCQSVCNDDTHQVHLCISVQLGCLSGTRGKRVDWDGASRSGAHGCPPLVPTGRAARKLHRSPRAHCTKWALCWWAKRQTAPEARQWRTGQGWERTWPLSQPFSSSPSSPSLLLPHKVGFQCQNGLIQDVKRTVTEIVICRLVSPLSNSQKPCLSTGHQKWLLYYTLWVK